MVHTTTALAPVPAHVSPERVIDFNFYHPPGAETDVFLAWKRLHDGPDFVWTPHNGGHWIPTRGEDIEFIQTHPEIFSSSDFGLPPGSVPMMLLPVQSDGEFHAQFRNLIYQSFTPRALLDLEQQAVELTNALIDTFYHNGKCEFMVEFARRLPIDIFLQMVELPLSDRDMLLELTERSTRGDTAEKRISSFHETSLYLEKIVSERRGKPGKDALSVVINGQVFGRPLTHEEMMGTMINILFGGLDTLSSTMSFVTHFLATNPQQRKQLIDQPGIITDAIEELCRRFAPTSNVRYFLSDLDYKGIAFKKEDRVLIPTFMHSMDERIYADPLTVDFKRKRSMHAAFGRGIHRCLGSFIARTQLKVFLQEWLKRIPDFTLDPGGKLVFVPGMINSMDSLPLQWAIKK